MLNLRKALSLILLGSLGLTNSSCVDNNSSIFIRQVQARILDEDCTVMNEPDTNILLRGTADAAIIMDATFGRGRYEAALLIGNQLIARADPDRLRPETSGVNLTDAEIEVFDRNGASLGAYSVALSGFVDTTSTNEPGYGLARINLLDGSILTAMGEENWNQTVTSRVKVYGVTQGGTNVETAHWDFPIDVCNRCLINECPDATPCEAEITVATCIPGQDGSIGCRAINNCSE